MVGSPCQLTVAFRQIATVLLLLGVVGCGRVKAVAMDASGACIACDGPLGDADSGASAGDAAGASEGGLIADTGSGDTPTAVPPYDGRYVDGSFEDVQGFGWDTCYTRTPGLFLQVVTGDAPVGNRYVVFESGGCAGTCNASNKSSSQVYLWFSERPSAAETMGLYFEIRNAGNAQPTGLLHIFGTDGACQQESALAEVSLDRLQPSSDWATRCVNVNAPGAHAAIGMAIAGGNHKIGLDGVRLSRPCQ